MSPHERGRIGVIEDDETVGKSLVQRLKLEGYTPIWWRTGQEALEGLQKQRPNLVVCETRLPDMSGEDVFLQALPRLAGTPFLVRHQLRQDRGCGSPDEGGCGRLHRQAVRAVRSARAHRAADQAPAQDGRRSRHLAGDAPSGDATEAGLRYRQLAPDNRR